MGPFPHSFHTYGLFAVRPLRGKTRVSIRLLIHCIYILLHILRLFIFHLGVTLTIGPDILPINCYRVGHIGKANSLWHRTNIIEVVLEGCCSYPPKWQRLQQRPAMLNSEGNKSITNLSQIQSRVQTHRSLTRIIELVWNGADDILL